MMQSLRKTIATVAITALAVGGALVPMAASAAAPARGELPSVSPTPQKMDRLGADVTLPGRVEIVANDATDASALSALRGTLAAHGVDKIDVRDTASGTAPVTVTLGAASWSTVTTALGDTAIPDHAEGYALRAEAGKGPLGSIALGGADAAGQFYAVKTLGQLIVPTDDGGYRVAGASISDFPVMPLRGTIEGFYGEPWTHAERLDQMAFYGDIKANTYIYAPKDDPYHREKWREPYPADKIAELGELITAATANHVRFTFALSPGNTVCYSSDADYQAMVAKLQQMYDMGVRAFNIPLDDIDYASWHCDADRTTFGAPSARTAGLAQAAFLDRVQKEFIETHEGAHPLQMVPTEYYNSDESGYKAALRDMDEDVIVMWTGNDVVPQEITVAQAKQAAEVFGGPTFLWDNYPVNDYGQTAGRLLLAPYDKREAGLSEHLSGIVSNPMNQASASKIAVFGIADFSWNDAAYDARDSWTRAINYVTKGDATASAALHVFADLNHLAPSFGSPWQPQSPELKAQIDAFWATWDAGNRAEAIATLRAYAQKIADAPAELRAGATDPMFLDDAKPWLDATALWGTATLTLLDALQARVDGDVATSETLAAEAQATAADAAAVIVDPPDNRWGKERVRIADGVLDAFHARAGFTLSMWEAGDVVNVAPEGVATASSVEVDRFAAANVNDGDASTRWASGYDDASWVQVALKEPTVVRGITLKWEAACAKAYELQTSVDGKTWKTIRTVDDSTCGLDLFTFEESEPVNFVRMQGVQRTSTWGYSIWEFSVYAAK